MKPVNWPFLRTPMPHIVRAEGVYLYDAEGRRILDAAGGAIVANIGHGRRRVADAVGDTTLRTTYVVPPWTTPSRNALVEALETHWLPPELRRIHVTSGGSEAVEAALKLAVTYHAGRGDTRRVRILARSPSYHGTTWTTTALSGHSARKRGLDHALPVMPVAPTPQPLHCPLGAHHPDCGRYYVEATAACIEQAGPETLAALIAEPIVGSSGGAVVPPETYLPGIAELCRQHGLLLIFDEVMTGFGRTGKPFAYQHWPVTPDILIAGKGLAGGYAPLGGVFASEDIGATMEHAGYPVMFHTFGAHPAACAAAAEVLSILVEENLVNQAALRGAYLARALSDAFADHPHVAETRGRGLLQAIEVVQDRDTLTPYPEANDVTRRIVAAALRRGVFFYGGGTGSVRDILCMGPAFIIDESEIDHLVAVLQESVEEVTGA
jgi:adenosylmethionine-8-amino-7-oxononanoate aminotransferase